MRVLMLLAALLALPAPARAADPAIEDGSAQRALDEARGLWAGRGLADYSFRVRRSCFCPPEFTVRRRVRVRAGKPVAPPAEVARYASVPRLFAVVQDAIDDRADRLEVAYGDAGMPRRIYVDRSAYIADEELGLTTRGLRDESDAAAAQRRLDAARAKWRERGLRNYGYRVRRICFCPREWTRPYRVHVRRGRPVGPHRYVRDIDTVRELFAIVQRAIDGDADELAVRYGRRGVPVSIFIDRDRRVADEELGVRVREFRRERGRVT